MDYEDLEELPHYDTINNFLKNLENHQLEKIRKYMIKELLNKRSFEHYRYNDKYWPIAIDATGMFSFNKKSRWKIENEAFNNQKNISYDIEHACCLDYNAIKNHYLLIQIADILKQLFEKGSEVLRILKLGKKEISSILKNHFSQVSLIIEDISVARMQIRDL